MTFITMTQTRTKHSITDLKITFEDYLFRQGFEHFPPALYKPALHIMSMKAKRIRPILLLSACEAFGGDIYDALDAACAIEMYHNFTLVHDDIIDEADLRRNHKTLHKTHGLNTAILTGDVMSHHALTLLNKVPRDKHYELMSIFIRVAAQVIEGEMLDVEYEERATVSVHEYIEMIRLKTSVFLAAALQMGAILGGASYEDQHKIFKFGENLGIAFQIKDDYLDTFGDQKTFGKRIGGDILLNKKTFLLCQLLEKADQKMKEEIYLTSSVPDDEKKIHMMQNIYKEMNVDKDAAHAMKSYYQEALRNLSALSLPAEQTEILYDLVEKIQQRRV